MDAVIAQSINSETTLNPEFKNAVRQQTSLLAPLERVCLSWFARNIPSWGKPDPLTLLGLPAMRLRAASPRRGRLNSHDALLDSAPLERVASSFRRLYLPSSCVLLEYIILQLLRSPSKPRSCTTSRGIGAGPGPIDPRRASSSLYSGSMQLREPSRLSETLF